MYVCAAPIPNRAGSAVARGLLPSLPSLPRERRLPTRSLSKRHWSLQVGKGESFIKPSFINTCDPLRSPRCRKPPAGTQDADLVCQKRIYFFGGCEFFFFIEGEEFNEHEFLRTPGAEKLRLEPSPLSPPHSPATKPQPQPSKPLSVC